ncbi:MAG TPA: response regulator [Elusimicrobiota bacterium]|nr:response regulator [Elusimicrobiota bacterium]
MEENAETPSDAESFASPADKLILVVDDDEGIRALVELIAKGEGFQVATAVDGVAGAEAIEARTPDLIVADLMMPRQGGYEFLRGLQASGNSSVPVMIVTGSALNDSTISMLRQEANVVEIFRKPIRAAQFSSAIHRHLGTAPKRS